MMLVKSKNLAIVALLLGGDEKMTAKVKELFKSFIEGQTALGYDLNDDFEVSVTQGFGELSITLKLENTLTKEHDFVYYDVNFRKFAKADLLGAIDYVKEHCTGSKIVVETWNERIVKEGAEADDEGEYDDDDFEWITLSNEIVVSEVPYFMQMLRKENDFEYEGYCSYYKSKGNKVD